MKKREIEGKFSEIVDFAETARFIDTPVKHYSSGMYMRLAFAVAAHLECDILLVDEVLAVGDAAFQKKCLGKMDEVTQAGKTVVFVSHNMQAVQSLCARACLIADGRIEAIGAVREVVARYLSQADAAASRAAWPEAAAPGNDDLRLVAMRVVDAGGACQSVCPSSQAVGIELEVVISCLHASLCIGFDLVGGSGEVVLRSYHNDAAPDRWPRLGPGPNRLRCLIPAGLLNAGVYRVAPRIGLHNICWIVNPDPAIRFEVVLDHGRSPFWNSLDARSRPGTIAPIMQWRRMADD
jgi:lipopolysaccharide transport system ATP-binding protein